MRFNKIGAEGGKALGEALKTNTTLTSLEYVAGAAVSPSRVSCRPTQGDGDDPMLTFPPRARSRSLTYNGIGPKAEAAVREAWKHDGGLTGLSASSPAKAPAFGAGASPFGAATALAGGFGVKPGSSGGGFGGGGGGGGFGDTGGTAPAARRIAKPGRRSRR